MPPDMIRSASELYYQHRTTLPLGMSCWWNTKKRWMPFDSNAPRWEDCERVLREKINKITRKTDRRTERRRIQPKRREGSLETLNLSPGRCLLPCLLMLRRCRCLELMCPFSWTGWMRPDLSFTFFCVLPMIWGKTAVWLVCWTDLLFRIFCCCLRFRI